MKTATAIIVLLYLALGYSAFGLTPAERTIVEQMRDRLQEAQKIEKAKDLVITTLTDTLTLQSTEATAMSQDLRARQAEIKDLLTERDTLKEWLNLSNQRADKAEKKADDLTLALKAEKLESHKNAKERDVVVWAFAVSVAVLVVRIFGPVLSAALGQYAIFSGPICGLGGLAAGYGLGRLILHYLSALIP